MIKLCEHGASYSKLTDSATVKTRFCILVTEVRTNKRRPQTYCGTTPKEARRSLHRGQEIWRDYYDCITVSSACAGRRIILKSILGKHCVQRCGLNCIRSGKKNLFPYKQFLEQLSKYRLFRENSTPRSWFRQLEAFCDPKTIFIHKTYRQGAKFWAGKSCSSLSLAFKSPITQRFSSAVPAKQEIHKNLYGETTWKTRL
jgi:hypothetical protein